jgi:hypothetical protein
LLQRGEDIANELQAREWTGSATRDKELTHLILGLRTEKRKWEAKKEVGIGERM